MSYVNSVLGKDERVQYKANISFIPFLPRLIFGIILIIFGIAIAMLGLVSPTPENVVIILGVISFLIGLFVLIQPIIIKETTELVITNRRIIAKVGFFSRHTVELNLSKIESIGVSQSILGRILDYGDLEIIGTGGTKEPITNISKPLVFRREFDEAIHS